MGMLGAVLVAVLIGAILGGHGITAGTLAALGGWVSDLTVSP